MNRTLLLILTVLSFAFTSCENMQVDADAAPVTLEIFV